MSELIDWDEIDASPAEGRDERVVRMAVPGCFIDTFPVPRVWPSKYAYLSGDNASSLGGSWHEARRHPIVSIWESQSRAEWAPQAQPLGDEANPLTITKEIEEKTRTFLDSRVPAWKKLPPSQRILLVAHLGFAVALKREYTRLTKKPRPEVAETLLDTMRVAGIADRLTAWVQQASENQLLRVQSFIEVAETLEVPEPQRYEPNEKGYMQESANGFWVGHPFYVALRTRLAEVEAQSNKCQALAESSADKQIAAEQSLAAMTADLRKVRLALGLSFELHGCSATDCNEAAYLKDAEEMIEAAGSAKYLRAELERLKGEMAK